MKKEKAVDERWDFSINSIYYYYLDLDVTLDRSMQRMNGINSPTLRYKYAVGSGVGSGILNRGRTNVGKQLWAYDDDDPWSSCAGTKQKESVGFERFKGWHVDQYHKRFYTAMSYAQTIVSSKA